MLYNKNKSTEWGDSVQNNLYLYPNLVKVRKSRMTQSELAKLIGITQQEISRYESGEIKAPINYITDLANYCNVSVDYILGRDIEIQRSDESKYIVSLYSQLSDDNKMRIVERIKTLIDLQNEK